jgi:hypothetical protein
LPSLSSELREEWNEAQLLPMVQRDAYFESALIDVLITFSNELSIISSLQDCKMHLLHHLKDKVEVTTAGVANGAPDRLARKLFLYIQNKDQKGDSELEKLLKTLQKSTNMNTTLVEQYYKDGVPYLVVQLPDFDDSDEDTRKVLLLLVSFALKMHQTPIDNLRIVKDPKIGSGKLSCPQSFSKLMRDMISSSESSLGLYAGEVYKFSSGCEFNLVECVAAMRLLNTKQEFIRKQKFSQESGKSSTSFNVLQETFNVSAGLKAKESSFIIKFIKTVIKSSIMKHNKGFPGGWIHASRTRNKVKSDFALLNVMGWTEKVSSTHKLNEVIFNTVDPRDKNDLKSKEKIINITADRRQFLHAEFRTAVALTLPRLDTSKPQNHEVDYKLDPLSVKDLRICNNFCVDKRDLLVDQLNEAYIFRVSEKNPKSKTKPIHYKIARDRLLNLSSNMPLKDATGKQFTTFSAIPAPTQKWLREKFRYPAKRVRDEVSQQVTEITMEGVSSSDVAVQAAQELRPNKRTKFTKGEAKEAVRRSGRIAKLQDKSQN